MKKGFTLIELLAVIIILAVIALIATPIVLNVVDEAKKQANLQTVNGIIDTARLYYTESMLDDDKKIDVDNINDIYSKISVQGHKPEVGKLYVNDKGLIAVSLILDEKCYIKNFTTEVEIKDKDNCDLGFVGKDEIKPTVEFSYSGTIGNNDWYTSDSFIKVTIKDNESGPRKFIWCSTESETCEPDNEVEKIEESIAITTNTVGKKICVRGIDNLNNSSEIVCSNNVKVDKTAPTLTAKPDVITITQGDSVNTNTYFNTPTYSISGGSISCSPNNTSSLAVGNQTVTCTALGNNGLSNIVNKNIIVKEIIKVSSTVYLNPATGLKCSNYVVENSNTGAKTGCLKWYVYKINGNSIGLILDHNTTATVAWNSSGINTSINEVKTQLTTDTNSWTATKSTVDLLDAYDVAKITGHLSWTNGSDSFYLDTNTINISPTCQSGNTTGCKYGWLYDRTSIACKSTGCLNNAVGDYTIRYWTKTPHSWDNRFAWTIRSDGRMAGVNVDLPAFHSGVRPVITVSLSTIS